MRTIIFFLILFLSLSGYVNALDWDLMDEDMASITDWTDEDKGVGVSSQATFDSKSCMKLYVPAVGGSPGDNYASRRITLSNFIDYTFEVSFYVAEAGGTTISYFVIHGVIDDTNPNQIAQIMVYNNKIRFQITGSDLKYADAYIATGCWNQIRILKESGKVSVWINDLLYSYEYSPVTSAVQDNQIVLRAYGSDGARTVYIDWARLDSTAEHIATSPLSISNEKIVIRYRQRTDSADYPNGIEALTSYGPTRFGSAEQILSIPLVATNDANASKVRFYDGVSTKSLMKLPN